VVDHLNIAYKEFAEKGIRGITQFIDKNDTAENLIHKLLALHIDKLDIITSLLKKKSTYDNLFDLISAYPDQIKFNKQLFIYRENPSINMCFLYGISTLKPITIPLFKNHFKLSKDIEYYDSVWMTLVESWYSALDVNNLTAKHMKDISEETAEIILKLNKHQNLHKSNNHI